MDILLKFLIHKLKTVDGNKKSAKSLLKLMQKNSEKEHMKIAGNFMDGSISKLIKKSNEHKLYRKIYIKYLIMRIRSKISFMAFIKNFTI